MEPAGERHDGTRNPGNEPCENDDGAPALLMAYRVEIKPTARRTNGAVGDVVLNRGTVMWFAEREVAEDWAADLTDDGESTVWIQAAPPQDSSVTDGYLMGRGRSHPASAPFESEQRSLVPEPSGDAERDNDVERASDTDRTSDAEPNADGSSPPEAAADSTQPAQSTADTQSVDDEQQPVDDA